MKFPSEQLALFRPLQVSEVREEIKRLKAQEPEFEGAEWVSWFEKRLDATHRLVEAERNER